MKEFVCFSTTDDFVPVSQLSTRDLFDFLENLKIKQDIFVLSFLVLVRSCRTTSVMILLFQIIFRNSSQEGVYFLSVWDLYKVNCGVDIGFLTHLFSERCLNCDL